MTQDEIIELALKVDLMGHELAYSDWYKNRLKAFGKLVAEKEREACAEVCDDIHAEHEVKGANWCADAIRTRGET